MRSTVWYRIIANLRVLILATGIVVLGTGCWSFRHPPGLDSAEKHRIQARLPVPRLVIGIREPVLRLDEHGSTALAYTAELSRAVRLIKKLRETDLFASVDFVSGLTRDPDLVLEAREGPPGEGIDGQSAIVSLMTLWVWPVIENWQKGVYFSRVDRPDSILSFDWPITKIVGWVCLPLNVLPGWGFYGDPDAFEEQFLKFLLDNRDAIWDQPELGGRSLPPHHPAMCVSNPRWINNRLRIGVSPHDSSIGRDSAQSFAEPDNEARACRRGESLAGAAR